MHFTLGEKITIAGIVIVIVSVFWLMISLTNEAIEQCKKRGGQWVYDGTYTYIWHVIDTKTGQGVLVPYPNSSCTVK